MGLRSIKEIFITGHGPSSSHTMGPYFASQYILRKYEIDSNELLFLDDNIDNINAMNEMCIKNIWYK